MIDRALNLGFTGEQGFNFDVATEQGGNLIERHHVKGIGHRERKTARLRIEGDRQDLKPTRHLLAHHRDRVAVGHDFRQIDALDAQHFGQYIAQYRFADQAQAHENLAEPVVTLFLLR